MDAKQRVRLMKAPRHTVGGPPLPYSVNDDKGQPWSDHLVGGPHALKHYALALRHGIVKPTVTDKDGEDITKWVLSEYGDGCEQCHTRGILTNCPECGDDVCDDCFRTMGMCDRCQADN